MVRRKVLDRQTPTIDEVDPTTLRHEPALALVDDALMAFAGRTLVTGHEVVNCLLDLRNALAAATSLRQLDDRDLISR
jgi:hypothetical protein